MSGFTLRWTIIILITFVFAGSLPGQNRVFDYKFLHLQENQFRNIENTPYYGQFMSKLNQFCGNHPGSIDIVHIGDSHMQAGFYSNRIRLNLQQTFASDTNPNLGFIFPYTAAQTNNPGHYTVSHTGTWAYCKAVDKQPGCSLGLSGITLTTKDTSASIRIHLRDYFPFLRYTIMNAGIFCQYPDNVYRMTLNGKEVPPPGDSGRVRVAFDEPTDTLLLKVSRKKTTTPGVFSLSGLVLERKNKGVNYHAIGVNGAKAESYLRCDHLPAQIKQLHPDLVILSLGTNEAYSKHFCEKNYHDNLSRLVQTIRNSTGNTAIILTTPGDALHEGKYDNPRNSRARDVIMQVARQQDCAWWDFYKVMGGDNAILDWYLHDLTAKDKLHLNKKGYQLKADLFFEAFWKSFEAFRSSENIN